MADRIKKPLLLIHGEVWVAIEEFETLSFLFKHEQEDTIASSVKAINCKQV